MDNLYRLYQAPFKFSYCYFTDSNGEMVADCHLHNGSQFRARGWGRFKYMERGEILHDQMEKLLLSIVKGFEDNPEKCVELLNKAWKDYEDFHP